MRAALLAFMFTLSGALWAQTPEEIEASKANQPDSNEQESDRPRSGNAQGSGMFGPGISQGANRRGDPREQRDFTRSILQFPTCPFSSNRMDAQLVQSVATTIRGLRERDEQLCPVPELNSQTLQSQITALSEINGYHACNDMRQNQRDYDFVQSSLDGSALGFIPPDYVSCFPDTNGPGDRQCIDQRYQNMRRSTFNDCRAHVSNQSYRLAEQQRSEAVVMLASTVSSLLSNPSCTAGDGASQLTRAGVSILPLIASSVPGFGVPMALGAELVGSIFRRLLAGGESSFEQLARTMDEENLRCLHYQLMMRELDCEETPGAQDTPSDQIDTGIFTQIDRVAESLSPEQEGPVLTNQILEALDTPIYMPDRSQSTLRQVLTEVAESSTAENPLREAELRQIGLLLNLRSGTETELAREGDLTSLSVLNYLQNRYPRQQEAILQARLAGSSGERVGARPNTNLNDALNLYTQELQRIQAPRGRNRAFSFESLQSIRSEAQDSQNRVNFRAQKMHNQFNICAFNGFTLLADNSRLRTLNSRDGSGDSLRSITAENATQFQSLCGEFSCLIPIPSAFNGAEEFRTWQCRIIQQQRDVQAALRSRLEAWEAGGGHGSICPSSSEEESPQESQQ